MAFHLGYQQYFTMDKGAFRLDLLCDRLMGEMLAVEEIFLVFKLVCFDLTHSFLFS